MTDTKHSPTIWIDAAGARLAAEDEGDPENPTILLVHSAVVNRRSWDDVVPHLLDAGYRVIRYDMRGFGESTSEDVEFRGHEDALVVLDHFGVGHAAVVGNSMGAHFALDAILAAPEQFTAYVWVGGGMSGFDKDPTAAEMALFEAEEAAEQAGDWDLATEIDTQIWMDGVGQPATRVDPEVRAAFKRMDRELLEPGRVYGNRKAVDAPAAPRLHEVRTPTLVVIGDLDTDGTRTGAEKLAAEVPGARLIHLPDVAHMVGMEKPVELAALIVEFLAPLPRWS
ncbi:MAG TPA: alpha/beta hydrolase [Candidatus Limnocylindrales bacterium]|jgi:pimeloyl-ACP methyl ester carboxylesterase